MLIPTIAVCNSRTHISHDRNEARFEHHTANSSNSSMQLFAGNNRFIGLEHVYSHTPELNEFFLPARRETP